VAPNFATVQNLKTSRLNLVENSHQKVMLTLNIASSLLRSPSEDTKRRFAAANSQRVKAQVVWPKVHFIINPAALTRFDWFRGGHGESAAAPRDVAQNRRHLPLRTSIVFARTFAVDFIGKGNTKIRLNF
jgi:hypothetical protein